MKQELIQLSQRQSGARVFKARVCNIVKRYKEIVLQKKKNTTKR